MILFLTENEAGEKSIGWSREFDLNEVVRYAQESWGETVVAATNDVVISPSGMDGTALRSIVHPEGVVLGRVHR